MEAQIPQLADGDALMFRPCWYLYMDTSFSFSALPSAANPITEMMIEDRSASWIVKTFGSYRVLMLYPAVERVSPARMAKSGPEMPSVTPPLLVYLMQGEYRIG